MDLNVMNSTGARRLTLRQFEAVAADAGQGRQRAEHRHAQGVPSPGAIRRIVAILTARQGVATPRSR
jgi:hypothetical protein